VAREPLAGDVDGFGALVADLRRLGSAAEPAAGEVDAVEAAVLARLAGLPPAAPAAAAPRRARARLGVPEGPAAWFARRRRRLAVALVVVLLALTGVPAVRAAVADWFGFAGVRVRLSPEPGPTGTPAPPPTAAPGSVAEAGRLVAFVPLLPAALGPPDGVEVSADRKVLSMTWTDPAAGVVRLDEFDGGMDYAFAKSATEVEAVTVGGEYALWFERPHEVRWLVAGESRRAPPRLAGHTLIWEREGTTLRLEGDLSLERALAIAESAERMFSPPS
jgi:hypothetical protein